MPFSAHRLNLPPCQLYLLHPFEDLKHVSVKIEGEAVDNPERLCEEIMRDFLRPIHDRLKQQTKKCHFQTNMIVKQPTTKETSR